MEKRLDLDAQRLQMAIFKISRHVKKAYVIPAFVLFLYVVACSIVAGLR